MGFDIYRRIPPTLTFFYCCSSKTGGRIIGWLQMVFGIILFVLGMFIMVIFLILAHYEYILLPCVLVICGISFIPIAVVLLKGIKEDKLGLIRYWLMSQLSVCIMDVVVILLISFPFYHLYSKYLPRIAVILLGIFGTGLDVYYFLVVSSYYSSRLRETGEGSEKYDESLNRF